MAPLGPWADQAGCRDADPELFFAHEGETRKGRPLREAKAKAVCAMCPVRVECLDDALADRRVESGSGVWGGTTEREREVLVRAAARAARRARAATAATTTN